MQRAALSAYDVFVKAKPSHVRYAIYPLPRVLGTSIAAFNSITDDFVTCGWVEGDAETPPCVQFLVTSIGDRKFDEYVRPGLHKSSGTATREVVHNRVVWTITLNNDQFIYHDMNDIYWTLLAVFGGKEPQSTKISENES